MANVDYQLFDFLMYYRQILYRNGRGKSGYTFADELIHTLMGQVES